MIFILVIILFFQNALGSSKSSRETLYDNHCLQKKQTVFRHQSFKQTLKRAIAFPEKTIKIEQLSNRF